MTGLKALADHLDGIAIESRLVARGRGWDFRRGIVRNRRSDGGSRGAEGGISAGGGHCCLRFRHCRRSDAAPTKGRKTFRCAARLSSGFPQPGGNGLDSRVHVHTWEMAAVRAWGVTFFATVIAWHGSPAWLPDPTMLFTLAGLAGVLVAVTGNESAQRWGRSKVVLVAMSTAAALSLIAGWTAAISTPLAVIVLVLWNAAIYLDSSALTAGTVGAAEKEHRGATMGLHSMCGYAGGCVGPPLAGFVLDVFGPDTVVGWGFAFGHLALITLTGLAVVRHFNRATAPRIAVEAA
jgi:hypothetical protein